MEPESTASEQWRGGAASAMERVGTLTVAERQLHHAILRAFPRFGGPPPAAWLAEQAETAGPSSRAALEDPAAKDVIQLDPATGVIVTAYPFSGVPTPHRVEVAGGQPVYAMCAIDALGIPFMLGLDATLLSTDPVTSETIRITVCDGAATWQPATACMFAGCISGEGPISRTLCPMINFFASSASAEVYAAAHPEVTGTVLDQPSAVRSGRRSFGEMLSPAGASCTTDCCRC